MRCRAFLEHRRQLRPESSGFLMLLMKHPLVESPQWQEEQHETEEHEPAEKSSNPENVGGGGGGRRPPHSAEETPAQKYEPRPEGGGEGAKATAPPGRLHRRRG